MTAMACSVFVEGRPDKALIECILDYRCIDGVGVEMIGGGVSKLGSVANQIRRRYDSGRSVALIVDADCDLQMRRTEYESALKDHGLHIDHVFFLPDNENSGCLENLLEMISLPEHNSVYECFQQYEECLHRRNTSYRLPSLKGKVYAYCEAVGGLKGMRPKDNRVLTACGNESYWNLAAEELQPLVKFLSGL